jgi:hypothetical protein
MRNYLRVNTNYDDTDKPWALSNCTLWMTNLYWVTDVNKYIVISMGINLHIHALSQWLPCITVHLLTIHLLIYIQSCTTLNSMSIFYNIYPVPGLSVQIFILRRQNMLQHQCFWSSLPSAGNNFIFSRPIWLNVPTF